MGMLCVDYNYFELGTPGRRNIVAISRYTYEEVPEQFKNVLILKIDTVVTCALPDSKNCYSLIEGSTLVTPPTFFTVSYKESPFCLCTRPFR